MYRILLLFFLACLLIPQQISAQITVEQEVFEGVIIEILDSREDAYDSAQATVFQQLLVHGVSGSYEDDDVVVDSYQLVSAGQRGYSIGDRVMVNASHDSDGVETYYVIDFVRKYQLLWLFGLFVGLVLLVGGNKGAWSLVGLVTSFVIVFVVMLPQLQQGTDPILTTIISSALIVVVTFYVSHGVSWKTSYAVIGTVLSLIVTGLLAKYVVNAAFLSGFETEEANFLQYLKGGSLNMQGILLAGIVLGTLGVLDDITISQSSIVHELKRAKPTLSTNELFLRSMRVGRDHIGSLVNTLILVYAGSSLPLMLLFMLDESRSISNIVNYGIVSVEIVRMLVGSIGLVLAVPITTYLTSQQLSRR